MIKHFMNKIFLWIYRLLLIPPIIWTILATCWYFWCLEHFGSLLPNDTLYAIEGSTEEGKMLEFFSVTGMPMFVACVLSYLSFACILPAHLLLSLILKKKIRFDKHIAAKFSLVFLITILLNFIPGPEDILGSYSNYILD
jgi:glucan phosphoethanolaminetransferase (alkaline phosphatase superfamily)